jgi:phage baseplate assembly protein W
VNRHLLAADTALRRGASQSPSDEVWLAQRIRVMLETQRGSLPWRPELGCDLARFVGQPLTPVALATLKRELERGLDVLEDVRVLDVDFKVSTTHGVNQGQDRRMLPVAERSLVQLGTQCTLDVGITVEFNGQAVFFEVQLQG